MLDRLRERLTPHRQRTEQRRRGPRWTPLLYLLVLAGLVFWAVDAAVGQFFYLRADGMVVAEATAVATEYTATVEEILVERGERVREGDLIAKLSSLEISERIGNLSLRNAENLAALEELQGGRSTLPGQLEAATDRLDAAHVRLDKLQQGMVDGVVTGTHLSDAHDDNYRALSEADGIESQLLNLEGQIEAVQMAVDSGIAALANLEAQYNGGRLTAAVSGIVSDVAVSQGDVIRPGQSLMKVYRGEPFVLGFLPASSIYTLVPGDRVSIGYGLKKTDARIGTIEPVAPELPEEFQKTFQPVERQQLAYVYFDDPKKAPPLFSKVKLGSVGFPPLWLLRLLGFEGVVSESDGQSIE